jgi:hypothetical protein
MTYERREYIKDDANPTTTTTETEIEEQPNTVVGRTPQRVVTRETPTTYVHHRDSVGNAFAASQLIQTIVWSAVVLVLLAIGILILIHYHIL